MNTIKVVRIDWGGGVSGDPYVFVNNILVADCAEDYDPAFVQRLAKALNTKVQKLTFLRPTDFEKEEIWYADIAREVTEWVRGQ